MLIKTYGIYGLSEWHGMIKAGTIKANVSFTGGTASPSGAQPAYFVTKDPITQFVIENSKEFKDNFIRLISSHELPGTHHRMATPAAAPKAAAPKATKSATKEKAAPKGNGELPQQEAKAYPEVTHTQEAKEILRNEYGMDVDNIRSKGDAHEAAQKVNIVFPNLKA